MEWHDKAGRRRGGWKKVGLELELSRFFSLQVDTIFTGLLHEQERGTRNKEG